MGPTVALYVDQDPFWEDARTAADPEEFLDKNAHRLPVALRVEVKHPVKCAAFLTTLRAFVLRSAPGMVEWENRKHGDFEYVRVGPSAEARKEMDEIAEFALYYATLPDSLVLTPSEALLKRALDRRAPAAEEAPAPPAWLGQHVALAADRAFVAAMDALAGPDESFRGMLQRASWGNLPILNEWKRLFPDRDPVEVHERILGTQLVCPGGGRYAWNEEWKTMESTAFGHPGQPKEGPAEILPFAGWRSGRFGLTLEEDGLRAACELLRE
jgi:hypothetical protein